MSETSKEVKPEEVKPTPPPEEFPLTKEELFKLFDAGLMPKQAWEQVKNRPPKYALTSIYNFHREWREKRGVAKGKAGEGGIKVIAKGVPETAGGRPPTEAVSEWTREDTEKIVKAWIGIPLEHMGLKPLKDEEVFSLADSYTLLLNKYAKTIEAHFVELYAIGSTTIVLAPRIWIALEEREKAKEKEKAKGEGKA